MTDKKPAAPTCAWCGQDVTEADHVGVIYATDGPVYNAHRRCYETSKGAPDNGD